MLEKIKSIVISFLIFLKLIEKPHFGYKLVDEHPTDEEIEDHVIYVVGGKGYQKWAYFRCPTDKTEVIQLSLMQKHRPRWRIECDWIQRPTIHPSVRQTAGSYAHFWVKSGDVQLCADSGLCNHNAEVQTKSDDAQY